MNAATLRTTRLGIICLVLLLAGVGVYLLLRAWGESLSAPSTAGALLPRAEGKPDALPHVLLALVVIVLTAHAAGRAFAWLGQPPVIGEVVAGILLGPSFL